MAKYGIFYKHRKNDTTLTGPWLDTLFSREDIVANTLTFKRTIKRQPVVMKLSNLRFVRVKESSNVSNRVSV